MRAHAHLGRQFFFRSCFQAKARRVASRRAPSASLKFLMKSHRRGRSDRPRSNATSSCNRDRAAVASRGALDGSRSKTIDELVLLVGDKLVEYQVLVVVYAVLGLQR